MRRGPTEALADPGSRRLSRGRRDAIITDTERLQVIALGGEILLLCDTRAYPTSSSFILPR
jgi:hypothetical protein